LNLGISNVINELGSINSFAQVIHLEKLDNISEKTGVGEAAEPSTWQSTESSVACRLGSPCPVDKSSLQWASLKTSEEVQRKITLITPCKSMQKKNKTARSLEHGNRRKM